MTENTFRDKNYGLATAVADRDALAVINCLKRGADVHFDEGFPLRCAVYLGYIEIAELLLKNGANANANSNEPLFTAIRARDRAMIDLLLDKGASLKSVLDTRKGQLDQGSIDLIAAIQTRESHTASEKRKTELNEKARKTPRPIIKVGAP
jgi:ankyrin repeat protein